MSIIKSYVFLDRNEPRPIHEQLRNGIELAIFSGELVNGDPLPSIRVLSDALEIAPNTIIRTYQDLQTEELVRSEPKRGYYVTVTRGDEVDSAVLTRIEDLVSEALDAAAGAGLDASLVMSVVDKEIRSRRAAKGRVVVVGYANSFLSQRVEWVREAIADLDIDVVGLSFEELAARPGTSAVDEADAYLVPVGDWHTARDLLGPTALDLVPMTRDLRPDIRAFIASQPSDARFGVIEYSEDRLGRILANLRLLHPLQQRPLAAVVHDRAATEHVLRHADVLLIGGSSRPLLVNDEPFPVPHVELVSVPDEKTLRLLRARLRR